MKMETNNNTHYILTNLVEEQHLLMFVLEKIQPSIYFLRLHNDFYHVPMIFLFLKISKVLRMFQL